jgi:hypothetical protein
VRGQFSKEANLKAATGLQTKFIENDDLEKLLIEGFNSQDKFIEFIQHSLRSASDIYKKGGHVVDKFRDQVFRLQYDNRRFIIDNPAEIEYNPADNMYYSKPANDVSEILLMRHISKA